MAERVCETANFKIRKTNLECPLESMKAKNGVAKEAVKPRAPSSMEGLSHLLQRSYVVKRLNFADMGLLVSCCRKMAYLSNAGVPQAALSRIVMAYGYGRARA